jgi:putative ABC transport system permease protein
MNALAQMHLSHNWLRAWFAILTLILAGIAIYLQLGLSNHFLSRYALLERQATAPIVVLSEKQGNDAYEKIPDPAIANIGRSSYVGAFELIRQKHAFLGIGPEGEGLVANIIDPMAPALSAPLVMSAEAKRLLQLPNSVLLTDEDAKATGLGLGDEVEREGVRFRVVGLMDGNLGPRGSMISRDNLASLNDSLDQKQEIPVYSILIAPKAGTSVSQAIAGLNRELKALGAQAMSREQLTQKVIEDALKDQRDIRAFIYLAIFIGGIALLIISQAIHAMIAGQRVEFATLLAMGVPKWRVALLVLEQTVWIGLIASAFALSGGLLGQLVLEKADVYILLYPSQVPLVSGAILATSCLAGMMTLPTIFGLKPVELLR